MTKSNTSLQGFYFRDDTDPSTRRSSVFAVMPAKQPLGPERGEYMMNYRVDNVRGFLEQLHSRGVVSGPIEEHNDGRSPESKGLFAWITDLEGKHLELYQPI